MYTCRPGQAPGACRDVAGNKYAGICSRFPVFAGIVVQMIDLQEKVPFLHVRYAAPVPPRTSPLGFLSVGLDRQLFRCLHANWFLCILRLSDGVSKHQ